MCTVHTLRVACVCVCVCVCICISKLSCHICIYILLGINPTQPDPKRRFKSQIKSKQIRTTRSKEEIQKSNKVQTDKNNDQIRIISEV
jgi:hypothetical protein